jgi:hypothetical protein
LPVLWPREIIKITFPTSVRAEAQRLQAEGVNILIALGHSGYDLDQKLAEEVEEIDLVVGGHSHTFLWTGKDLKRMLFSQYCTSFFLTSFLSPFSFLLLVPLVSSSLLCFSFSISFLLLPFFLFSSRGFNLFDEMVIKLSLTKCNAR